MRSCPCGANTRTACDHEPPTHLWLSAGTRPHGPGAYDTLRTLFVSLTLTGLENLGLVPQSPLQSLYAYTKLVPLCSLRWTRRATRHRCSQRHSPSHWCVTRVEPPTSLLAPRSQRRSAFAGSSRWCPTARRPRCVSAPNSPTPPRHLAPGAQASPRRLGRGATVKITSATHTSPLSLSDVGPVGAGFPVCRSWHSVLSVLLVLSRSLIETFESV